MIHTNSLQAICCIIAILFASVQGQTTKAANSTVANSTITTTTTTTTTTTKTTTPPPKDGCKSTLFTAYCCQRVEMAEVGLNKRFCAIYNLDIYPIKIDLSMTVDNSSVLAFQINANNPPKYCLPLLIPDFLETCVKLHDITYAGFLSISSIQICSTIYVTSQAKEVFSQKLGCVKVSSSGVEMMTR